MITALEIQDAIFNGEVELWEVEKIVRGMRARQKLDGERAPATALHPFLVHNPTISTTRPTKDGCTWKTVCSCGFEGRYWLEVQARPDFVTHQNLSGWRR